MGREERKLQKCLQQREQSERRKLAQKEKSFKGSRPVEDGLEPGQVIATGSGFAVVETNGQTINCTTRLDIAVGDHVQFSPDRRRIERITPRTTVLSRPDPHNPRIERVLAANVDVVVLVVSLHSPPLRPGLIDRYLIAIERSGADPLLCVNKIDLEAPGDELKPYAGIGVPVVYCSAATGAGLDQLREALGGRLCVFSGHSGVGKSSLLNALDPNLGAATGAVSEVHQKGRHTTTGSRMYELPGGTRIIDTPGIREFGLWNIEPDEVRRYFHEFDDYAWRCAFSDCTHTHEPECAVKEAVDRGLIPEARYSSYRRIL